MARIIAKHLKFTDGSYVRIDAATEQGSNGTDSTLKADGYVIKSDYTINGVVKFSNTDVFNAGDELQISTEADIAAVVQYLQQNDFGVAGATLAFDVGADTFIFTQTLLGDDYDILVRLEDTQIDSLVTTISNVAGDLFLQ